MKSEPVIVRDEVNLVGEFVYSIEVMGTKVVELLQDPMAPFPVWIGDQPVTREDSIAVAIAMLHVMMEAGIVDPEAATKCIDDMASNIEMTRQIEDARCRRLANERKGLRAFL